MECGRCLIERPHICSLEPWQLGTVQKPRALPWAGGAVGGDAGVGVVSWGRPGKEPRPSTQNSSDLLSHVPDATFKTQVLPGLSPSFLASPPPPGLRPLPHLRASGLSPAAMPHLLGMQMPRSDPAFAWPLPVSARVSSVSDLPL